MRHFAVSIIVFALLFGSVGSACGAPVLFGDFAWGTPKSELDKRPGASPGEGSLAGDVLLPEAMFASLPWNVRLEFANERLVRVSLMERYSRERMDAVTRQLRTDKFEMLSVLIDASFLDLVKILKARGPDGVKEEWERFVKDKKPERMVYAWFDTTGMSRDMKSMAGSLQQLLMMAPVETREVEVSLLRDPATSAPGMLLVDFSFPAMQKP
jgi:uncharacterized protein YbaA (DUF1428 family)